MQTNACKIFKRMEHLKIKWPIPASVCYTRTKNDKPEVTIWERDALRIREKKIWMRKVTLWCAMSENEVIGPYYFVSSSATATSHRHLLIGFSLSRYWPAWH